MRITTQFSVFLINQPGILSQVVSAIADAKINVQALTIVDSHEHGVLRLVTDQVDRLRAILTKLNLPTHESQVLAIELANRAGALALVLQSLAQEHINIDYAYVTAGAPGGRTTGILHVNQLERAAKILEGKPRASPDRFAYRGRSVNR